MIRVVCTGNRSHREMFFRSFNFGRFVKGTPDNWTVLLPREKHGPGFEPETVHIEWNAERGQENSR